MNYFDNTGSTLEPVTCSLGLTVDDTRVSYTYIRKNACSAFKRLFSGVSPHDLASESTLLKGMIKHHLDSSADDVASADYRICVLRDPVQRVVSVFKNKFVQMSKNKDIVSHFENTTGIPAHKATFRDFVNRYVVLLKQSRTGVDPHLWLQSDHLFPVNYNAVIKISNLKESIEPIIGKELADTYFSQPLNASSGKIVEPVPLESPADCLAEDLNFLFKAKKYIPKASEFLDDDIRQALNSIYSEDYRLLNNLV